MATNAISAQNSKVEIATGTGGAKNITGVTVGNPTLFTSTAHGLLNGDVVTMAALTGADAGLFNTLSFVVTNKTANTFALQVDTTGKTITAGSGTATPVTYTEIKEVKSFDPSGQQVNELEVTHLQSTAKEFVAGLPDSGEFGMELNWVQADPGQAALVAGYLARTTESFKVTAPDNTTFTFSAIVKSMPIIPKAAVDAPMTITASMRITGDITVA